MPRPSLRASLALLLLVLMRHGIARADCPCPPDTPPPSPPPPTEKDYWKSSVQGGLIRIAGNSNSLAISGLGTVARDDKLNVATLTLKGTYATASSPPDNSLFARAAAANWLGALRYDRLLGMPNADGLRDNDLFVDGRMSQDKFAGVFLRGDLTAGYGRFFVRQKALTLRGEVGANYQHQWAASDPNPLATMPATDAINYVSGGEQNFLGGRLGVLFEEKLMPLATFTDTAELTLAGTPDLLLVAGVPVGSHFRALFLNTAVFSTALTTHLSFKVTDTLKVNSQPPPTATSSWDNTLEVGLALSFL